MKQFYVLCLTLFFVVSALPKSLEKNFSKTGKSTCEQKLKKLEKDCDSKSRTKTKPYVLTYHCGVQKRLHKFTAAETNGVKRCEESYYKKNGTKVSKTLHELSDKTVVEVEKFVDPKGKPRFVINGNGGYLRVNESGGEFFAKVENKSLKVPSDQLSFFEETLLRGKNPFAVGGGFGYPNGEASNAPNNNKKEEAN